MRLSVGAVSSLVLLFLSACSGNTTPPPGLPTPPAIRSFLVDKNKIAAGETVTLTWTAENAETVEVVDQAGTPLSLTGDASSGSAVASPTTSAFYVLKVKGPGGRDTAFVQVAVDEDLQDVFLVAVPTEIDSGDSAQLLWSAHGATAAEVRTSEGVVLPLEAREGSGVLDVQPERTVGYTLRAEGVAATSTLEMSTQVRVRPRVSGFEATPQAARPGETLTLKWSTAGAAEVVLSESTFGELIRYDAALNETEVKAGTFEWTVPETRPNGAPLIDGFPLRFKLSVRQTDPDLTLTRTVDCYVGDAPQILEVLAPKAVTAGKGLSIAWRTANAVRLQIWANGGLIYEPLAKSLAEVAQGSVQLAGLATDTEFELVAWSFAGAKTSRKITVRRVAPPSITSFTLPGGVGQVGEPATASWETANASQVVIRVKGGAPLFFTDDAATVAQGSASVYPGVRTTFELVAYNDAQDFAVVEGTVDVGVPGTMTATPSPVTTGETVTVTWAVDAASTSQLIGDPLQVELRNNPAQSFYDLDNHVDATEVVFADPNDALRELTLPAGFAFPFAGTVNRQLWVSTNGFISLTGADPGPTNEALDSSTEPLPSLIAPFWDDLQLGANGKVFYFVEGTTFPRRLIVQWNRVQTDDSSELTFQAQLLETGEVRFIYRALSGLDAYGESASIGWRLNATLAKELANGAAVLTPDDEVVFFSSGAVTGTYDVSVDRKGVFTLYARLPNGAYVVYPAPVNVIAPGSVMVNEAMILPDALASNGQWIELYNASSEPVDLEGTVLTSASTQTSHTFPAGMILPPNAFLVLGASTDPNETSGAPIEFAWTGLTPDAAANDELTLTASGPVSGLAYDISTVVPGTSVQPPERAINSSGTQISCTRSQTFGTNGAIGTPGAPNETCFDYAMTPIAVQFEDISSPANAVFPFGSSMDFVYKNLDFGNAPFTYYGTSHAKWTVSSDGWIAPGTLSSSYGGNKSNPSTSTPVGTIAVFWDDLANNGSPDANVYLARRPGVAGRPAHWIVQWKHFEYWSSSPNDEMNFEAKLFDDGVIEFHFADMISGTGSNYAAGTSATTWIERPTGDAALPVGKLSTYMTSHQAWRFTPKN